MARMPNLYIIGAPKCGTTAMADYLREHPDIFVPLMKEFLYFGTDIPRKKPRMSEQKYLECFDSWGSERFGIDATPMYLYSKSARWEIKAASEQAKIMVMVRNPTDMVYSLYSQLKYEGKEFVSTLEEALSLESERVRTGYQPPNGNSSTIIRYSYLCKVAPHVKACFDCFGRENVHVIIYDDFKLDTKKAYIDVLDFLNLDIYLPKEFGVKNSNKRSRSKMIQHIASDPPAILGPILKPFLSRETRWKIRSFISALNGVKEPREEMNPETRLRLNETFATDVEYLSEILDRDLTEWTSSQMPQKL